MGFFAVGLGQTPLQVPDFMNCAALMHQLLVEPLPQRLMQPAAAVGHEVGPPGKREDATLQIPELRFVDVIILRQALPKSQSHLLDVQVFTQRDEKGIAASKSVGQRENLRQAFEKLTGRCEIASWHYGPPRLLDSLAHAGVAKRTTPSTDAVITAVCVVTMMVPPVRS